MSDFSYAVVATINGTFDEIGLKLNYADIHYQHTSPVDDWVDDKGAFTEKGVDAMINGFAIGLVGVIHSAGQGSGMDTAALLRKAISVMEDHFVARVNSSHVVSTLVEKPARDGTQPEEIP